MRAIAYLILGAASCYVALASCPIELCDEQYYLSTSVNSSYDDTPQMCKAAVYNKRDCINDVKQMLREGNSSACVCDEYFLSSEFTWAQNIDWDLYRCDMNTNSYYYYTYGDESPCGSSSVISQFASAYRYHWYNCWKDLVEPQYSYMYNAYTSLNWTLDDVINVGNQIAGVAGDDGCGGSSLPADVMMPANVTAEFSECRLRVLGDVDIDALPSMLQSLQTMCEDRCPLPTISKQCREDVYQGNYTRWTYCRDLGLLTSFRDCINNNLIMYDECQNMGYLDSHLYILQSTDEYAAGCEDETLVKDYMASTTCADALTCGSMFKRSGSAPGSFQIQKELHQQMYELMHGAPYPHGLSMPGEDKK